METRLLRIIATIWALFNGSLGLASAQASSSAPSPGPSSSGSFTQDCFELGLTFSASCNETSAISNTCCQALDAFNQRGCFCNGAVTGNFPADALALITQAGPVILGLCSTSTAILQPSANNCPAAATAIGSCGVPDWKIDAMRLDSLNDASNGSSNPISFLTSFYQGNSSGVLTSDSASYGFSTLQDIEEFFTFTLPDSNDGVQLLTFNSSTDLPPRFVGKDTITAFFTSVITIPAPVVSSALLASQTYNNTNSITFEPCSTKIKSLEENLDFSTLYMISKSRPSDLQLCSKIQSVCQGKNQVYDSVMDCVIFFDTLPDRACTKSVFTGNCKTCRHLHYVLAKVTPEVHCAHVGKTGGPDRNGMVKCVDSLCGGGQLTPEAVFLNGTRAAQLKMLAGVFAS